MSVNRDQGDHYGPYLAQFRKEPNEKLMIISEGARERRIPIMQPETMSAVEQLIRLQKPKKILEIGSAVGYSAINMAVAGGGATKVVSLERDPVMVQEARRNVEALGLSDQITILEKDALVDTTELSTYGPFNFLFIDAGKGHYTTFFESYTPYLASEGLVVCDNVLFRGWVTAPETAPKRLQKMAEKMHNFNQWLHAHPDYKTTLLPVGDGLSVSIRNT
jgi:predicted O-methyltransferase YrrM